MRNSETITLIVILSKPYCLIYSQNLTESSNLMSSNFHFCSKVLTP